MSDKIDLCPFCGSKYASVIAPVEAEYQVQCGNCYAASSIESTEKKAIKAWNHRAQTERLVDANKSSDNPPLTLEELRGMEGKTVYVMFRIKPLKSLKRGVWIKWASSDLGFSTMEFFENQLNLKDYGESWIAYRYKPEEPVTNRNDLHSKPGEG